MILTERLKPDMKYSTLRMRRDDSGRCKYLAIPPMYPPYAEG